MLYSSRFVFIPLYRHCIENRNSEPKLDKVVHIEVKNFIEGALSERTWVEMEMGSVRTLQKEFAFAAPGLSFSSHTVSHMICTNILNFG